MLLFNRDLNRGCLVYMFSLRFFGGKFLINLWRQFRVRESFRVRKNFRTQVLRDLQSFHFISKIIIRKFVTYVLARLLFH